MPIRTEGDALSLTLPKASRSQAIKRWKPPKGFWYWLFWTLIVMAVIVADLIDGEYIHAMISVTFLVWYWHNVQQVLAGRRPFLLRGRVALISIVGWIALAVVLDQAHIR